MPIISLVGASAVLCLQSAIYFEARSEPIPAQTAVAQSILNRVDSKFFPNDVCSVVKQKNQYSWYWDGKPENVTEVGAWDQAGVLARYIMELRATGENSVAEGWDATHFVSDGIRPHWTTSEFFSYDGRVAAFDFYTEERRW